MIFFILALPARLYAQDPIKAAVEMEKRYASVKTLSGNFQQTYHAPGIVQTESGVFWLKRPAFMRWEYREPEEKLFIADGRETFLYVPQERQVTVQSFSSEDLRGMPLELLMGGARIQENYLVTDETEIKPKMEGTILLRLTPRRGNALYSFVVFELERAGYEVRRLVVREQTGNTSEFVFTNVKANIAIDNKKFQFTIPKGVEVIRLTSE